MIVIDDPDRQFGVRLQRPESWRHSHLHQRITTIDLALKQPQSTRHLLALRMGSVRARVLPPFHMATKYTFWRRSVWVSSAIRLLGFPIYPATYTSRVIVSSGELISSLPVKRVNHDQTYSIICIDA